MKDKILHALACFFAVLLAFSITHIFFPIASSVTCGLLFAFGLGIGKEVGDALAKGKDWDKKDSAQDLVADLIGCGVATVVIVVSLITGFIK